MAIRYVTLATEKEKAGEYQEALGLYLDGLDYFDLAMKWEAESDYSKEAIRNKIKLVNTNQVN